jgi:prepilin-type N-terminal cleavage/methylation domain-containing protein
MGSRQSSESGFTLVELTVTIAIFAIVFISFFALFTSLVNSTIVAKRQAVALTLATNQMEYLKSLPYDNLAVSGGSIISSIYLPASTTKVQDGVTYVLTTSIDYVDDAYDGCGSYPNATIKAEYCRGYNANTTTVVDTNPADYKIVHVAASVAGTQLAQVDTEIASQVSETASTTGALFVSAIDGSGNVLPGATISVKNTAVSPAVNVSEITDSNGYAIFYDLPPDSNADYIITASLQNYSTLSTIAVNGSLQPTYPNQKIIAQQSSFTTLTLKPEGANSLIIETTDTSGNPLPNAKIYVKGGYKKYTATSDTTYYYDTLTPSDTRPVSDSTGLVGVSNLVPGNYIFCGDTGATSCTVGSTTYYLAAAVPYGGTNTLNPIIVPIDDLTNPPTTTFSYGGANYLQKVRLMLTTKSTFPRLNALSPSSANLSASNINAFPFTVTGSNLPCTASASSCGTTVSFQEGTATYPATCTGSSSGVSLSCTVNLTSAAVGTAQLTVSTSNGTITLPANPLIGGISVAP